MKRNVFYGFLIALMGGIVSISLYKIFEPEIPLVYEHHYSNEAPSGNNLVNLLSPPANMDFTAAAESSIDGVVHVKVTRTKEYKREAFDPFRFFFNGDGRYEQKYIQPINGMGSGVIISENGYIVTNNHVIENADEIKVTLNDKKSYDAELVGYDYTTDLAVLKIDAKRDLNFINYGNSDAIRIGEWVLAVGNPFNLTSTVTAGIVSAKSRNINILGNDPLTNTSSIESFIQTDAAVNPGNSGGALVNTHGELVGINTAIKSNTGSYTGYSFAIPSNIVQKVVNDLIKYGYVQRAFIGVNIRNIDADFAKEKKIENLNGVYILGMADKKDKKNIDLKEGDIIKSVDGTPVSNVSELIARIGIYHPGDEVKITYLRNGKLRESKVILKNRDGKTDLLSNDNLQMFNTLGAQLEDIDKDIKEKLSLRNGVLVKKLYAGKLQKAGIQEGFIITSIDSKSVKSVDELIDYLKAKKGGVLVQGIYPNGRESYYGFGM